MHFEIGSYNYVEPVSVRESDGGDLCMSLGYFENFACAYPLSTRVIPEMHLFLSPSHIVIVILILNEVFNVASVAFIARNWLNAELKRFFVESDIISMLLYQSPLFIGKLLI